jgi:hypothetical protein
MCVVAFLLGIAVLYALFLKRANKVSVQAKSEGQKCVSGVQAIFN